MEDIYIQDIYRFIYNKKEVIYMLLTSRDN